MRFRKKKEQGISLILVLVLLAISTGIFSVALLPSSTKRRINKLFRQKSSMEALAQTGFDLAVVRLGELSRSSQIHIVDDIALLAPEEKCLFKEGTAEEEVVFCMEPQEFNIDSKTGWNSSQAGILSVRIRGDMNNDETDPSILPRKYFIQSELVNLETGRIQVIEGEVVFRPINLAELSFGMLNPPADGSPARFIPGEYEGKVVFGDFIPYFNGGSKDHTFKDKVYFMKYPADDYDGDLNEDGYYIDPDTDEIFPFQRPSTATVGMQKGVEELPDPESSILGSSSTAKLDIIASSGTQPASWENEELCLEFKEDGFIERYDCETSSSSTSPWDRYGSFMDRVPADKAIIYSTEDIHFRGVLSGQATIISQKNIVAEGDMRYSNQSMTTSDRLGAIAIDGDIVIPRQIPNGEQWDGAADENDSLNGSTNFPVDHDRFVGDQDGDRASNLALDGFFFAPNGKLDVEGINDFENASNGISIVGESGEVYSTDPADANYFYKEVSPDVWEAREISIFCGQNTPVDQKCTGFSDVPRKLGVHLGLNGGLVVGEFSNTFANAGRCMGFDDEPVSCMAGFFKKVIKADPNLGVSPPPGFDGNLDLAAAPEMFILWQRSFGRIDPSLLAGS